MCWVVALLVGAIQGYFCYRVIPDFIRQGMSVKKRYGTAGALAVYIFVHMPIIALVLGGGFVLIAFVAGQYESVKEWQLVVLIVVPSIFCLVGYSYAARRNKGLFEQLRESNSDTV